MLCYFLGNLSPNSPILLDMLAQLPKGMGLSMVVRDVLPSYSTVVVIDVYGPVKPEHLAASLHFSDSGLIAVAIVDDDVSDNPDDANIVHVRPAWKVLEGDYTPPQVINVIDDREPTNGEVCRSAAHQCAALTRNGRLCQNKTRSVYGYCWRHRPGK
jgi:hypothetical protein